MKIKEAQQEVKDFTLRQSWLDVPNIDKIDHIHEELTEISRLLRYKTEDERKSVVIEHKEKLQKEIGDVLFCTLRLSNQLGVDAQKGFLETLQKVQIKFASQSESQSSDNEREAI